MFRFKIFIIILFTPCLIFSEITYSEFDELDPYEILCYYEEKIFHQTLNRIDRITSISSSKQTFENTIEAFIKEISIFHDQFHSIKKLISSNFKDDEIKQQMRHDFKEFLQIHVLENKKLIQILSEYAEMSLNQENITNSNRNLMAFLLDRPFPLFVSHILKKRPLIQSDRQEYLLLCKNKKSKTKIYMEGNANSEGEKSAKIGIQRKQQNESSRYSLDVSGKIHQDKDGKTKAEASTKVELEF